MQRKLRVCCEFPPRHSLGADSRIMTLAPASRAISAAHSAAFPPPITSTSSIAKIPGLDRGAPHRRSPNCSSIATNGPLRYYRVSQRPFLLHQPTRQTHTTPLPHPPPPHA